MRIRYILIILFILCTLKANSQPSETIYQGTVIKSGYVDDAVYGPLNIGFTFTFFGNNYTQFYVNSNGQILFGTGSSTGNDVAIPTSGVPDNFIAAFWDDLVVDGTGNILYATIGASPNRKLFVQYKNTGFYGIPAFLGTFYIILYENSNKIQVQYRLVVDNSSSTAHGKSATIGIENSDGSSGMQYAYHDSTAVSTGKAISFTPSGPTYTMDTNAIYDGVVLTTNITLPEPGIPVLLSPSQDAIIGSDFTFEWSESGNSASYTLLISNFSDLGGATSYNAGSSLSYNITGLLLDTTYYWGVFATNTTGTTWCEIKRFTTNSTPPLEAVPQTVWVEQNQDKTIKLNYTGGDASAKSAIITSLPVNGQLYQYNAGARGVQITSAPTIVTDVSRNVIYAANGTYGNGAGNFNFKIHDDTEDSPDAQVTVNVSPPGMPNLLNTGKTTIYVEMQFDLIMADPAGKQGQFAITVNGTPASIGTLSLKTGDPYTIIATLASPIVITDAVTISYTAGDITSAQGGLLASFDAQTVTLQAQTITFTQSLTKKFNESPFTLTATASSGLSMTYSSSNLTVATISGNTVTLKYTGTSDITARQAGNGTYAPAKYIRTLTVSKGDQTTTFSALPVKIFGDSDFSLTASASSGLSVSFVSGNTAVATVAGNTVHIVGAGTAVITASQAGNSLWNPAPDVPQTLTVNKADQTITFSVLPAKTYGDPDFTLTASTSSGLSVSYSSDNTAVATVTGNTLHIAGAGTAVITASQAGNTNYNAAADVPQTLTVNKANQTIIFSALSAKTYGNADFNLTATASSGLSVSYSSDNTAVATVTGNIVHITGAGSTVITASQAGDANYNAASDVPQTLIVSKANLTLTADNKTKEYLEALPVLTYTISGFVNSETESVLDVLPSISTTALQSSPVGDYPITLSGGNDNNYIYIFVDGTLTITKLSQIITITDYPVKLLVQDSYTLVASSSAGLSVTLESEDDAIATISGSQVTGIAKGSVQIRAYNDGDADYKAAEAFVTIEVYSTHKDIINLFTPNNDGFNDLWELPELSTWGNCEVKVYNRWGKLVYDNKNYNNTWDGTSGGNPVPEGPYYFVIKTENSGVVKGTVNIVR
jgi:gliding motility-associated-like protein